MNKDNLYPKTLIYVLTFIVILCFDSLGIDHRIVRDSLGSNFVVSNYSRIVSLAPSITEILSFIGVQDRIIGVTRYCKLDRRRLGGIFDLDIEGIISLNPDIVFMLKSGSLENYYLLSRSMKVFVLEFNTIDDVLYQLENISDLLMLTNKSKSLEFRKVVYQKINFLKNFLSGKKFLFIFSYPTIYTSGSNSYLSDIVRKM
ncbi:MAG: helical backbone metal receptor, partial [Brevinematia bacterium]